MMLIPFLHDVEELRLKNRGLFRRPTGGRTRPVNGARARVYHMNVGESSAEARAAVERGLGEYHEAAAHAQ